MTYLFENKQLSVEWHKSKNSNLVFEQVAAKSNKTAWWKCSNGHEWQATVASRTAGNGCPVCSGRKILTGYNDLATLNPELIKDWDSSANHNLEPQQLSPNTHQKAWWKCHACGNCWEAEIKSRNQGAGCPECGKLKQRLSQRANRLYERGSLEANDPKLASQWHPSLNGNLAPSDVMTGTNDKAWWLCPECGNEWAASIASRSNGAGCPACGILKSNETKIRNLANKRQSLSAVNAKLAQEWSKRNRHGADEVLPASNKKVWWVCSKGHEWQASVASRTRGNGCPVCSGRRILTGYNDLATISPELMKDWDCTANQDIDPHEISPNTHQKAWWKCHVCGAIWKAEIKSRNQGAGCPECGKSKQRVSQRANRLQNKGSLIDNNLELASQWHPYLNKDRTPSDVMAGTNDKAWWLCPECGNEWEANIASRTSGVGCPICGAIKSLEKRNATRIADGNTLAIQNPSLAAEWHPSKNHTTTPDGIAPNSNKKVWWMCSKGHEWEAIVNSRNSGVGCPKCALETHTSFPEQAIFFYFSKLVNCENRKKVFGHEIDIYIPSLHVGIEYDGLFYHSGAQSAKREKEKNDQLKKNGITLYRLKEGKRKLESKSQRVIICVPTKNEGFLDEQIKRLIQWVMDLSEDQLPDVNVERDLASIQEQYLQQKEQNSIAAKCFDAIKLWHDIKNGKLTPYQVNYGSSRRYWWKCNNGHEWQTDPHSIYTGKRCPYCSGHRVVAGENDLATINPSLASQWHPTKNGELSASDVLPGSNKKVWWKGDCGHEWDAVVASRNAGSRCPICSGRRILSGYNDLATLSPGLLKDWDYMANKGFDPKEISPNSHQKAKWECHACGHKWEAQIKSRNRGTGCPKCAAPKRKEG